MSLNSSVGQFCKLEFKDLAGKIREFHSEDEWRYKFIESNIKSQIFTQNDHKIEYYFELRLKKFDVELILFVKLNSILPLKMEGEWKSQFVSSHYHSDDDFSEDEDIDGWNQFTHQITPNSEFVNVCSWDLWDHKIDYCLEKLDSRYNVWYVHVH